MTVITSPGNPRIKDIRALRHRKERERTGLYYVEGIRPVAEAAEMGVEVEICVSAPELLRSDFAREIVGRLVEGGAARLDVSPQVFRGISLRERPQGLAAVVRQHMSRLDDIVPGAELCWIALAAVQDPGNLGTILRTSDAVGGAGVILLGDSTDPYDPATVRASMGAIFSQRLVRATPLELGHWKRRHGVQVVGTSDAAPLDYLSVDYHGPLILLMGSEREGLGVEEESLCDAMVRIPMAGRSDSLNLAVATGVLLYEIVRQRKQP